MKKLLFISMLIIIFTLPSCTIKIDTKNGVRPSDGATQTSKPDKITNAGLTQGMLNTGSYRRKIRTLSTVDGIQTEKNEEYAYVKKPLSIYFLLKMDTGSAYSEDLIIDGAYWGRADENGKWTKSLPGEWQQDPQPSYAYSTSTQPYPIDYEKLSFKKIGTEKVNGVNCIKYSLSGSYESDFSYAPDAAKYPVKLSASGTVWIADDPLIKTALICQQLNVTADITDADMKDDLGNPVHSVFTDIIEDNITDINSTALQPPPDSDVNASEPG